MKKTAFCFCTLLLLSVGAFHFSGQSNANPSINPQVPSIQITSPPYPPREFETSTVNLEIYVNMYNDSPKLTGISYSLDDGPLMHLENLSVTNIIDFGQDKIDFTMYEASTVLERLPEGNHTIMAYSGDLSVYRSFTVMSNQPSPSPTPTPAVSIDPNVTAYFGIAFLVIFVATATTLILHFNKRQRDKNS